MCTAVGVSIFMSFSLTKQLIKFFKNVAQEGQEKSYPKFPIGGILPKNKNEFYRYHGSLTTPSCDEVVVWTIFKEKFVSIAKNCARRTVLRNEVVFFISLVTDLYFLAF